MPRKLPVNVKLAYRLGRQCFDAALQIGEESLHVFYDLLQSYLVTLPWRIVHPLDLMPLRVYLPEVAKFRTKYAVVDVILIEKYQNIHL